MDNMNMNKKDKKKPGPAKGSEKIPGSGRKKDNNRIVLWLAIPGEKGGRKIREALRDGKITPSEIREALRDAVLASIDERIENNN
jgi:hypothetical protein